MWSRSELKSQAKTVLQGRYWTAFLVCLFVGGIGSAGATLTSFIPFAPLAVSLFITPPLIVGQSRWFSAVVKLRRYRPLIRFLVCFAAEAGVRPSEPCFGCTFFFSFGLCLPFFHWPSLFRCWWPPVFSAAPWTTHGRNPSPATMLVRR